MTTLQKRILSGVSLVVMLLLIVIYSVEDFKEFIIAFILRMFYFVKKSFVALIATFFLVKGKFILVLFLKKLALLSITGLGKRYMIERVFMGNVKTHFLDHLSDDIKRLTQHAKENFKNFPLVKKLITIFAFLGSLGFVGKFMGGMLAIKVFIAKVWSFLLAIFLKVGGTVVYFFTDYLWSSWLAPIIEVVVFSWFLSWLEKIPFLAKGLKKIYAFFVYTFSWVEGVLEKVFHLPMKSILAWFVKRIKKKIYRFIGYKRVSAWKRVNQSRTLSPNRHKKLLNKRIENKKQKKALKIYLSAYEKLEKSRKENNSKNL